MGAPARRTPPPGPRSDERSWALAAHVGGALTAFVAPLIVLLVKGNRSPTVRAHAVAALNFQIPMTALWVLTEIIAMCSFTTFEAASLLPLLVWAVIVLFSVLAGMQANQGKVYRYPLSLNLVS